MTNIPTWRERAMTHPDHQTGMVSEGMLKARMQEEIDDLRAERDEARAEVERLRQAVQWYGDRACALSAADNRHPFSDLFEDAGKRAREALEGKR